MSAQDHVLKQLPAADEQASTSPPPSPSLSPSPPRRDPVQDADPSFARKRPRLDSDSNSLHTMSASSVSPAGATTSPPPELVEMTIHSHPPSSPALTAGGDVSSVDGTRDDPMPDSDDSPIIMFSTETEPATPPVIIIDDDDDDADPAEAERYFHHFPAAQDGDYFYAIRRLTDHVQGGTFFIRPGSCHLYLVLISLRYRNRTRTPPTAIKLARSHSRRLSRPHQKPLR
jgi:ubiquitin carboxyl-terminal hydrolase 34